MEGLRSFVPLLVIAGCGFSGPSGSDDSGDDTTPVDAPGTDSVPGELGDVDHLPPAEEYASGTSWIVEVDTVIDTGTRTIRGATVPDGVTLLLGKQDGGGDVAILRVNDLGVRTGVTLSAVGPLPLVILSRNEATVSGTIDVGAAGGTAGAGGFPAATGPGAGGIG